MEIVGDMNLVAEFIAGYDGSITGRDSDNTADENLIQAVDYVMQETRDTMKNGIIVNEDNSV